VPCFLLPDTTHDEPVHLSGRLPGNPPVINARLLDNDADRKATAPVLGTAWGHIRQGSAKGPLADYVACEDFPRGPTVSSPDEVMRDARGAHP